MRTKPFRTSVQLIGVLGFLAGGQILAQNSPPSHQTTVATCSGQVSSGGQTFRITLSERGDWLERFEAAGLGADFYPVVARLENRFGKIIRFHAGTEHFLAIAEDGVQFRNVTSLNGGEFRIPSPHRDTLWNWYLDVVDGATAELVIPFPRRVGPVRSWQRAVFMNDWAGNVEGMIEIEAKLPGAQLALDCNR